MSHQDLDLQQTCFAHYGNSHNLLSGTVTALDPFTTVISPDSGTGVSPPDSTSLELGSCENELTTLDMTSDVWSVPVDEFTTINGPFRLEHKQYLPCDSTEHSNESVSTGENTNQNSSTSSSLECSPVDLQNLPSPLNNLDQDFIVNGDLPDSSVLIGQSGHDVNGKPNSQSRDWKLNALKYPPCVVCSGKSSGLHYGCYTCEACKNFFRRYLLRSGGFTCKKNNKCMISNKSRGNCSGCRLKKCLDVGMSKDKSKIGRYTHAQRTETIREVNKLEGKEDVDDDAVTCNDQNDMGVEDKVIKSEEVEFAELTDEEKATINVLVNSMDAIQHFGEKGATPEGREEIIKEHYEKYLAKVKMFGPLKAIPKEEYFTLLKLYNIDLDGRWNLFKREANNCSHIVTRYCEFAYKIPGFQQLNLKDQEALLKIGHCDFFLILLHEGYDPERRIFLEMNGVPSHVEEAADKIFSRELVELQVDLSYRWQLAKLMKEEKALLMAMSLLCSDRIELENPNAVSDLHFTLTEILLKFMHSVYGKEATRRFSKFIDILTFSRQASHGYFKEYQEMSQNEMVANAAPAFSTLCPDDF